MVPFNISMESYSDYTVFPCLYKYFLICKSHDDEDDNILKDRIQIEETVYKPTLILSEAIP